jgi:acetyl-CoA carboxylase biotin carboxyl carrier protein
MTIDEIRELIRVVQETGIHELEVRQSDSSVRIVGRTSNPKEVVVPTVLPVSVATPASLPIPVAPAAPAETSPPPPQKPSPPKEDEQDIMVKSPIVGTYYDAPAPGTPPFVRVGDRVEPNQVLCIIESMKLMNEIQAEVAGTIVAKLVENGRPVEYGESLFGIRPH